MNNWYAKTYETSDGPVTHLFYNGVPIRKVLGIDATRPPKELLKLTITVHPDNFVSDVTDAPCPAKPEPIISDDMLDRAMNASIPGGSQAWVWLFNCEGGTAPEDKHRDWFRRVLQAALQ